MAYLPHSAEGPNGGRINVSMAGNTVNAGTMISSGNVYLSGGNSIQLSQNGNSIMISGSSQSAQTQNVHNVVIGSNTTGTTALISSGTMTLAGGNNITLSQAGGNAVTISAGPLLQRWEHPKEAFMSLSANGAGQGSLSIQHVYVPFNVTGASMKIGGSLNIQTSTNGSLRTASISLWMGIYTLNGSTLSLASGASTNNTVGYNAATSGSTANSSVTGMRELTVPLNVNMAPGEYWIGAVISSAAPGQSLGFTVYGDNLIASAVSANAALAPVGVGTAAGREVFMFQGMYTAATAVGPNSIGSAQLNVTNVSNPALPKFYHAIYNALY